MPLGPGHTPCLVLLWTLAHTWLPQGGAPPRRMRERHDTAWPWAVPAPLVGRRPWGKKGLYMDPWGRMPHGRRMAEDHIPLAGPHGVR